MFKLLAGVILLSVGIYSGTKGSGYADFYFVPGIALIGAGLDTIFHKKWF